MSDQFISKISEGTQRRLMAEYYELLRDCEASEGSVGNAVKVVYEKDFADEHGIGRFGRMTLKEGRRVFHAGPANIDSPVTHQYQPMDYLSLGWKYREGQPLDVNLNKLTSKDEWPTPLSVHQSLSLHSIEKRLFEKLGTIITLINPSFKTMQALDTISSIGTRAYVYLSNTYDVDYFNRVNDFVKKSRWLEMSQTVQGVAYLGSAQPNFFPETKWVRLIPSPYILPCKFFQQFASYWTDQGYSCTYERKPGYFVNNVLRFDCSQFLYNPETVDSAFPDPVRSPHLAFLESSFPLSVNDKDDRRIYHKPKFLQIPDDAAWVDIDGVCYRLKGHTVFDVRGVGTYFSRRSRTVLPLMYHWAPFVENGSHWLTLSSLRPRREYNLRVEACAGSTFVCFGECVPVSLQYKKSISALDIDTSDVPSSIRSKYTPDKDTSLSSPPFRDEYWQDDKGGIYPLQLRREDAVAWLHQVQDVPFIYERDLQPCARFVGKSGVSFVDISSLKKGTYYLSPNRSFMAQMIPQSTKYFSKNFLQVFTYAPYSKSVEIEGEEYQSKLNPEWNNVISAFRTKEVYQLGDHARSENNVSAALDMRLSLVTRYVRVHPDMLIWRVGIEGNAEWVHKSSLKVCFPPGGEIGGKMWIDVMLSHEVFKSPYDVSAFRKFCLNNGYMFRYLKIGLDEVSFKVGRRI